MQNIQCRNALCRNALWQEDVIISYKASLRYLDVTRWDSSQGVFER